MNDAPIEQRPRTRTLVLGNAVAWCVWFAVVAHGSFVIGVAFAAMAMVLALAVTTTVQWVIHFAVRRRRIGKFARIALFAAPSLVVLVLALAVPASPVRENQIQDVVSPSGRYVLAVPIGNAEENSGYKDAPVWTVTIRSADGSVEYADTASTFLGYLNVYWLWDQEDRAWLYNSDDGGVYYWEKTNGKWSKNVWQDGLETGAGGQRRPPDGLYPDGPG